MNTKSFEIRGYFFVIWKYELTVHVRRNHIHDTIAYTELIDMEPGYSLSFLNQMGKPDHDIAYGGKKLMDEIRPVKKVGKDILAPQMEGII
jgi:hypothetical protein